jgi:cytoskeletal protein CcmA (bactofilin family)
MFKKPDRPEPVAVPPAPIRAGGLADRPAASPEPDRPMAPAVPARPEPAVPARPVGGVPAGGRDQLSVISAGLRVVGNLESDEDIQINGKVEGDVRCRSLTVSEGADVSGVVAAQGVTILGRIKGEVKASAVRLARSGRMEGDITYRTLAIEEGAALEGRCHKTDAENPAAEPGPRKPAAVGAGAGD